MFFETLIFYKLIKYPQRIKYLILNSFKYSLAVFFIFKLSTPFLFVLEKIIKLKLFFVKNIWVLLVIKIKVIYCYIFFFSKSLWLFIYLFRKVLIEVIYKNIFLFHIITLSSCNSNFLFIESVILLRIYRKTSFPSFYYVLIIFG